RRLDRIIPVWTELADLRVRQAARMNQRDVLVRQRAALDVEVRREIDDAAEPLPYFVQRARRAAAAHCRRIAALDETATGLTATRAEVTSRHRTAESSCLDLRPKAAARKAGRWYSPAYWRAKWDATLDGRLAEAECQLAAAKSALEELAVREQKLAADRRLTDEEHASERAKLIESEAGRRRGDLDTRITEIDQAFAADSGREAELATLLRHAGIDPAGGPTTPHHEPAPIP